MFVPVNKFLRRILQLVVCPDWQNISQYNIAIKSHVETQSSFAYFSLETVLEPGILQENTITG